MNFLNPIDGTPLAGEGQAQSPLLPEGAGDVPLRQPDREIRIAGGRELHLGSLQPLGLYAANSIFVGDYLTTKGQAPAADYKMIEELGFEVTRHEEPAGQLAPSAD